MSHSLSYPLSLLFFFNHTAPTQIYTLSLHDALPISSLSGLPQGGLPTTTSAQLIVNRCRTSSSSIFSSTSNAFIPSRLWRSEEHTSELQSRVDLVCRLLLEKKKEIQK